MSKVKFFQSWGPYPKWFGRLILGSIVVGVLVAAGNAFANHLGPPVAGVVRAEPALMCRTLDNAKAVAAMEMESMPSIEVFVKKYHAWNGDNEKCIFLNSAIYALGKRVYSYVGMVNLGADEPTGRGDWEVWESLYVVEGVRLGMVYVFILVKLHPTGIMI